MAYLVTNENLSTYNDIYHFAGKDVLTVIGSGDQYFTCKLNGANRIDVFDYDKEAWHLFSLKFMALRNLSYPDFYKFVMEEKMKNTGIYERLRDFLPSDVQDFFDHDDGFFIPGTYIYGGPKYGDGSIIPYFAEDNYYKLQGILNQEELPTFYHESILDLPGKVEGPYDIMLTSNIFGWLLNTFKIHDPKAYKDLLDKIPAEVIQANYLWDKSGLCFPFTDYGYHETVIPTVNSFYKENFVYTYTKKNIKIPIIIGN